MLLIFCHNRSKGSQNAVACCFNLKDTMSTNKVVFSVNLLKLVRDFGTSTLEEAFIFRVDDT